MKDLGNKSVMAANIKAQMKIKKINSKELSKAINVPYTTVLSWVNAEYYPRIDKIELMSEYFGVLKSDLIEAKGSISEEMSARKREFILRIEQMTESQLDKLEQILSLVDSTK